ncbi:MAG: DUF4129 domain-containing protein [Verrucomicrobiota bacterium]
MNPKSRREDGRGALELIEEAVHLLRLAPAGLFSIYYLGTIPFVMALLYFWADMSRSALAQERCAGAAAGLALLFLWMKGWQAVFADLLRSHLRGSSTGRWTFSRLLRLWVLQAIVQPAGLFLLPAAFVLTLPFAWTYAFFQNVTVLGGEEHDGLRSLCRKAIQQASLWPGRNHLLLAVLVLFGLFVFVNLAMALAQVPQLLKMFFGVETAFSRSFGSMLNTTFLAATLGLTYLCLDPLAKAVYVLRCFYGESLRSGEDLKKELKACWPAAKAARAVAVLCLLLFGASSWPVAGAASNSPPAAAQPAAFRPSLAPPELDRAIDEVIGQREYSWRLPRPKMVREPSKGVFANFVDSVLETMKRWLKAVVRQAQKVVEWLIEFLDKRFQANRGGPGTGLGWLTSLQILVYVLLAVLACTVAILFWRIWQGPRQRPSDLVSQPMQSVPDLSDDNVAADQLPEESWMRLAQELAERGELRLALRAFYLASLAHLAHREFIRIAKFKSNREYETELRRRTRAQPDLQSAFAQNVTVFDRVWYGMDNVSDDVLRHFRANLERINAC